MTDLPVPVTEARGVASPAIVALEPEAPSLGELFEFMRDAELRF